MKEFRVNDTCPPLVECPDGSPADQAHGGRRRPGCKRQYTDSSPCPCPLCRGRLSVVMGRLGPLFICDCKRKEVA